MPTGFVLERASSSKKDRAEVGNLKAVLGVCEKIEHYSQKDLVMSAAIRALSNTIQMLVKWFGLVFERGKINEIF